MDQTNDMSILCPDRADTTNRAARNAAAAPILIDGQTALSTQQVFAIAQHRQPVALADGLAGRLKPSRDLLQRLVAERRRIYGVTTGYGPLATSYIDPAQGRQLQRNLVYHLAAGVGEPLSITATRALMTARVSALAQGYSAISPALLERLVYCLNNDLIPVIPAKGTVGASGDLTPLAHLALALMGEGAFWQAGTPQPAARTLHAHGLKPLVFDDKEAIALVNGTAAMTGIAALNAERARAALQLAMRTTLLHAEMAGGKREAWHPNLAKVRPHPGQCRVTGQLWQWSAASAWLEPCPAVPPQLAHVGAGAETLAAHGVLEQQTLHQDRYSIRCAPQILGAIDDLIEQHARTVDIELNSATDNPLCFAEDGMLLHGGNFQGQQIAFASDQLMLAVIQLAVLAERQLAHLTHPNLSPGLPPFLQPLQNGLNSGFMGAQVSATALVAEMRAKAVPAAIQSISTNGDNQDIVSMGTIAARRVADLLDDLDALLAIQLLALAQAAEIKTGAITAQTTTGRRQTDRRQAALSADGRKPLAASSVCLIEAVRAQAASLGPDRPLAPDIAAVQRAWQADPTKFADMNRFVQAAD